jgi:hypothetical protein
MIITAMAGSAAEELLFGIACDGAGGSTDSDLGKATCLAAAYEVSLGFEPGRLALLAPPEPKALTDLVSGNPELAERTSMRLTAARARALGILLFRRGVLEDLSGALLKREAAPRQPRPARAPTPSGSSGADGPAPADGESCCIG